MRDLQTQRQDMNLPPQLWAVTVISLGVICAITGYVIPGDITSRQAIFTVANTLISGGLGALTAHAIANNTVKGDNSSATFPTSNQQ